MQCMQKDHSSAADKPPEVLQVPDSVLQGLAESQQPAGQITGTNHAGTQTHAPLQQARTWQAGPQKNVLPWGTVKTANCQHPR